MRGATERHRARTAVFYPPPAALHMNIVTTTTTTTATSSSSQMSEKLYHYQEIPGIISVSNKKCAHAVTHECPYLADSNSSLCTPCAVAAANGHPCS